MEATARARDGSANAASTVRDGQQHVAIADITAGLGQRRIGYVVGWHESKGKRQEAQT